MGEILATPGTPSRVIRLVVSGSIVLAALALEGFPLARAFSAVNGTNREIEFLCTAGSQQRLLQLYGFGLTERDGALQHELRIQLHSFGQLAVADPHHDMVSDHLALEITVAAVFR